MVSIAAHSTPVEYASQQLYFTAINKRSKFHSMNMGKRIEAELVERRWSRSKLYELVPGLEDGTLSAIIKRDSRSSRFAPAIANAFGVELQWLITGEGSKELGAQPVPSIQIATRDPILDDLAALEADEAAIWQSRIDEAQATLKRLHNEIRAAANKARRKQQEEQSIRRDDKPPGEHLQQERCRASS